MAERDPSLPSGRNRPRYEEDYAAWLNDQVELLRADRWSEVDKEQLIDEVESLGRSDFKSFVSAVRIVLMHMLKWDIQEDHRTRGWAQSIDAHRQQVLQELEDSPSYAGRREEALERAYRRARHEAAAETRLPLRLFPEFCPYSWDDMLTREHPLDRDAKPSLNR